MAKKMKKPKPVKKAPAKKKRKLGPPRTPRAKRPPPRDVGPLDLLEEAHSEIEALAEEMRSWANNMEDKLSATQKYQDVDSCADTLENIDRPSVDITALNDHKISWQDPTPTRRALSRARRAGDACDMLRAVEEKMRDLEKELPEDDPQYDAAIALADEVDVTITELGGVDFPGMY